jgi:hypothetical protein
MEIDEMSLSKRSAKIRELERLFDLAQRNREIKIILPSNFQVVVPVSKEKEKVRESQEEQFLKVSSELQELRNQFNKYLKVDAREESVMYFKEHVSEIKEVKKVYAQHKIDKVIFWILYDDGDKMEILEKIVSLECKFERVFRTLNFDYHILLYSPEQTEIFANNELIFNREDVNAKLPMA